MISPFAAYLIDVVGTAISAGSYLLMKLAHHELEEDKSSTPQTVYFNRTWQLGLACGIVGGVIHLLTLPYCNLVLLSTTACLSIVFSNILAIRYLGEKMVWKQDSIAFLLIVIGCGSIVMLS